MKSKIKAVCRVCLQCDLDLDDDGASSIFSKSDKCFIYEKLNSIADVNIKPKDGLPDKICAECLLELENAINFKQKCETSNSILVSAVSAGDGLKGEENVKEEPDDYIEAEYLEEEPESLPELTIKLEDLDDQPRLQESAQQSQGMPEIHIETPPWPSKAMDQQLECHDCGALFKSKCKLKVHWFKTHLTCNICPRKFRSFKYLNKHKAKNPSYCIVFKEINITGEGRSRNLHCKHCDYSTTKIKYMTKHVATHSKVQKYACKLCPKKYTQLNGLQGHMEAKHNSNRIEIVCNICGKHFQGMYKYRAHKRKHKDIVLVPCEICNNMIRKTNLENHKKTHVNDRSFTCDLCAATFKTMVTLYRHKQSVHDKIIYRYNCSTCGYSCRNHSAMKKHQQKHLEKKIPCVECEKFFDNEFQLSLHKEKHTKKNNSCPQCDEKFYARKQMLRHLNIVHKTFLA